MAPAATPTKLVVSAVALTTFTPAFPSISVAFSTAESILRLVDSFEGEEGCSVVATDVLCSTDKLDATEKLSDSLFD